MFEKVTNLRDEEDMLARLIAIDDNSHAQQKLYPRFTAEAGNEKVAMGIIILIQLTFNDYCDGMPPTMFSMLNMRIEEFIDALVADEDVASEAKEFAKQVLA